MSELILASASPRRRELLERCGLQLQVVPSRADETQQPGESPAALVERLSLAKATEVSQRPGQTGRWFLGSDTVVAIDGKLLGKPDDVATATAMLQYLAGRSHQVWSGYAVIDRKQQQKLSGAIATEVHFRDLSASEIAAYVATGEPFDKAGAYGIQGIGAALVESINGSYTSVVGLPLCAVIRALERLGVPTPFTPGPTC